MRAHSPTEGPTRAAAGAVFVLLAALFAGFLSPPAAEATWVSRQITDLSNGAIRPNMHNGQIAFEGDGYSGMYFWDGTYVSGSPSDPVQFASNGAGARLYGGVIVYDTSSSVMYWPGSGDPQAILSGRWPDIYDGRITYVTSSNSYDVSYWDGTTSHDVATTSMVERNAHIYGDQIVYTAGPTANEDRDVYLWNITAGTTVQITDTALNEGSPAIYDGALAWHARNGDDFDFCYRSDALDPATQVLVASDHTGAGGPRNERTVSLWEDWVVYEVWDGNDWEIACWRNGATELVTDNDVDDILPCVDGGMIAYSSCVDGTYQIMLAQIPEPSMVVLCAIGAVTLLRRWRRR